MSDILNIPELGELEIVEIYDYYNVPILFSCRNSVSHLYIVIFADHSPEYETWLYVEVSLMRLNLIRSGVVDLHDAFSKPEMGRLLKAMIPHGNSAEFNSEYITPDQLHSDVFPPVNEYLNLGDTPLFSETNLVEIAKSSGREIVGLKFSSIEEYRSEAPILPLGKILTRLQNVINTIRMVRSKSKQINKEIRNSMQLSILATQPGSFDIKLAFKKENTSPIKDIPSIQGDTISEFLNLLRSKDSESDLKDILKRLQSRVAEEYKRLLTSLSESGADTTFSWASPKSDEQVTVSLSKNEIPELIGILRTFQEEQETPLTVTGELIGISLSSKKFEIKTKNKTLYCHRKLGPPPKPRLCYNDDLFERSLRWRNENEEDSRLSLKRKSFLRPSAVKVHKQNCVDDITSAKINSRSGNSNSLKTQRPCLDQQIRFPLRTMPNALRTLSSSLGD